MSIEVSLLVVLIGGITSVPALFICVGILVLIKKTKWAILLKAVLWMVFILAAVLINFFIVLQLVEGKVYFSDLELIVPALAAVLLSFFFRLSQLTDYLTTHTTTDGNTLA
jgi:hypothetical protein